jgi:hypothetical protein
MSKIYIKKVESCAVCPNMHWDIEKDEHRCKRTIYRNGNWRIIHLPEEGFPDWCPLDDSSFKWR